MTKFLGGFLGLRADAAKKRKETQDVAVDERLPMSVFETSQLLDLSLDTEPLPGESAEDAFDRLLVEMDLPVEERQALSEVRRKSRNEVKREQVAMETTSERLLSKINRTIQYAMEMTLSDQEFVYKPDGKVAVMIEGKEVPIGPTTFEVALELDPISGQSRPIASPLDLRQLTYGEIKAEIENKLQSLGPAITAKDVRKIVLNYLEQLRPISMPPPSVEFRDVGNGELNITIEFPEEMSNMKLMGQDKLDLKGLKWLRRIEDDLKSGDV